MGAPPSSSALVPASLAVGVMQTPTMVGSSVPFTVQCSSATPGTGPPEGPDGAEELHPAAKAAESKTKNETVKTARVMAGLREGRRGNSRSRRGERDASKLRRALLARGILL